MHVERLGFTPLKGGRHTEHLSVTLTSDGPCGDREFCLVDPARRRVLRTVENRSLVATLARWDGRILEVEIDGTCHSATPVPTGETVEVDYWGRRAVVHVQDGPWGAALSSYLGFPVLLARITRPGAVVYGASVSLVATASVRELAARLGAEWKVRREAARFRPTAVVATDRPGVEDDWAGRRLVLGEAVVEVRHRIPRCAVVDLDPATGVQDAPVLKTLAGYRQEGSEVVFGVDAVVTVPGLVRQGDPVALWRRD